MKRLELCPTCGATLETDAAKYESASTWARLMAVLAFIPSALLTIGIIHLADAIPATHRSFNWAIIVLCLLLYVWPWLYEYRWRAGLRRKALFCPHCRLAAISSHPHRDHSRQNAQHSAPTRGLRRSTSQEPDFDSWSIDYAVSNPHVSLEDVLSIYINRFMSHVPARDLETPKARLVRLKLSLIKSSAVIQRMTADSSDVRQYVQILEQLAMMDRPLQRHQPDINSM
jgi:hypothetical protein